MFSGSVTDRWPITFTGNIPEMQIRQWLKQLLPSPYETLVSEAAEAEKSDARTAEEKYREALSLEPSEALAKIELGPDPACGLS